MTQATDQEVFDALSASVSSYRFRYEVRDHDGTFVGDITNAVMKCGITMDRNRAIKRTAKFRIDVEQAGGFLTGIHDHIAPVMELLVDGEFKDVDLGLFILDRPVADFRSGVGPETASGQAVEVWTGDASDMVSHLLYAETDDAYTVVSGTNYVTAIETVLDLLQIGLRHNLTSTVHITPIDFTWGPGTSWYKIVDELLEAINYFSITANRFGVLISSERPDWNGKTPDITYSGDDFIMSPFSRATRIDTFFNQVLVIVDDPARAPFFSSVTNEDPTSPVSKPSRDGEVKKAPEIDGSRFVDNDMATTVAKHEVRLHHYGATRGKLGTPIDPVREPDELYKLDLPGVSDQELWIADGWSMPLETAGKMSHDLRRVDALNDSLLIVVTTDNIE